jgi:hypothetical protein
MAHEVARAGLFDLDHLCTPFAEKPRTEWCPDTGSGVDNPNAFERL